MTEAPEVDRPMRAREENALHAYHDGELHGFARWRFERRLAGSPQLQSELATFLATRSSVFPFY